MRLSDIENNRRGSSIAIVDERMRFNSEISANNISYRPENTTIEYDKIRLKSEVLENIP